MIGYDYSEGHISVSSSGTDDTDTTTISQWGTPKRIDVIEKEDCIEFIYKETSYIIYSVHPAPPPEERVFKVVFSCKDREWHKSDRIYGKILPKREERYVFDDKGDEI